MLSTPLPNVHCDGSIRWPFWWRTVPLWSLFERVKDVGHPDEEMLSVYRDHGVIKKSSRDDNFNKTAENRDIYQLVDVGWLIINRMKAWQGSVGVSFLRGTVSGHYICFRPQHDEDSRFLNWLLRSDVYAYEYARLSRGVRPAQIEIDNDALRTLPIHLPPMDEQRRIADFLDAETARIDEVASRRSRQLALLADAEVARIFDALTGRSLSSARVDSGLRWLGSVPTSWAIAPVSAHFEVLLGKMLNPDRASGGHLRPYLRNTNVQWDRIDVSDLLEMDFPPSERSRYEVLPGDLLVCEGGEPGRAAIWHGEVSEIYYQKALHRVRPRSDSEPRWLFYCLRLAAAMNVFAVEGNLTTIAHLTGEQLRAQRFPFPSASRQREIVHALDEAGQHAQTLARALNRQQALLAERRQALITATVAGQFDVTTARGSDPS